MFYTSVYIGDLYKRSAAQAQIEPDDAEGTRLGARALFYMGAVSLFANVVLPAFVAETASQSRSGAPLPVLKKPSMLEVPARMKVHLATLWAVSHVVFSACMLGTLYVVRALVRSEQTADVQAVASWTRWLAALCLLP